MRLTQPMFLSFLSFKNPKPDLSKLGSETYTKKMKASLFHNRIRKVCALVAATLILPSLAYAQNNQGDNNQGDTLLSNNGLSYLITITIPNTQPPAFVARGVLTFHADHTVSSILSVQEGGHVQFSSQLGSWKFGNAGGLVARTIWFAFPNPSAIPAVEARVTRVDYTATFPNRTTVTGTFTITDFPIDGNPSDESEIIPGTTATFTFTGNLVTP